jgi:hypothetical protein
MATSREDELRELIARNADYHINAHRAEVKEWVDELCKIEARKPPAPVFFSRDLVFTTQR